LTGLTSSRRRTLPLFISSTLPQPCQSRRGALLPLVVLTLAAWTPTSSYSTLQCR
jgi:hypothetical protein